MVGEDVEDGEIDDDHLEEETVGIPIILHDTESNAGDPISHAEKWDDSVLIEAWDSAVEQYRMYHSQEAQEREAIQLEHQELKRKRKEERSLASPLKAPKTQQCPSDDPSTPNSSKEPPSTTKIPIHATISHSKTKQPATESPTEPRIDPSSNTPPDSPSSFSLLNGLDPDQANALMAWYWAGYYTGRLSKGC